MNFNELVKVLYVIKTLNRIYYYFKRPKINEFRIIKFRSEFSELNIISFNLNKLACMYMKYTRFEFVYPEAIIS